MMKYTPCNSANTCIQPMSIAASVVDTELAKYGTTPMVFSCPDIEMSTENHRRVSHAPFCSSASSHDMTSMTISSENPIIAAKAGDTPSLVPKIHMKTVMARPPTIFSSFPRMGPSSSNFFAAMTGASGVSFTPGGSSR